MSSTVTHRQVPAPRVPAGMPAAEIARLRAATYVEFLLGHGEAPGVDLGVPVAFTRDGHVYSQAFADGLTLANVGVEAVEVALPHPYRDLSGVTRSSIVLPAHSAEVLRRIAG
jgi:hypothetical protein